MNELKDSDRVILFYDYRVIVAGDQYIWKVNVIAPYLPDDSLFLLVESSNKRVYALDLNSDISNSLSAECLSLRSVIFSDIGTESFIAGKANQIVEWYKSHQYCGACGGTNQPGKGQRVMHCPTCQTQYFPRINPCAIMLITRGREILLARSSRFRSGFFSCLAGFIEIGETAECTVHREVKEEVGILVDNVRYIKSQSWPFPSQLMLGFHADYVSGEIVVEPTELEEAAWFDIANLPSVPSAGISVAGELIQLYKEEIERIKA